VIVLLDGKEIDAQELGDFLVLKLGEHELVLRRADGQVIRRWRFPVGAGDDGRKIILPPPEPPDDKPPLRTSAAIDDLAFSPDGNRLAAACRDSVVVVWDVATRRKEFQLRHPEPVATVAFTPDGGELLAGDQHKQLIVWRLADQTKRLTLTHPERVRALAVSPNGRLAFSGSGTQKLWDLRDGKELGSFHVRDWSLQAVAFSPDGNLVAGLGHNAAGIRLWDVSQRKFLTTLRAGKPTTMSMAFAPDGKTLAAGAHDGKVNLWDLGRRQVRITLPAAPGPVTDLYFNPDGTLLIGVSQSRVVLWDVRAEQLLPTNDPGLAIKACTLAPDGKTLACVVTAKGQAPEVRLLNVEQLRARVP
jgi:WD40 repeat protein